MVINADLATAADQSGCACLSRASSPAAWGLDIDVPEIDWNNSFWAPSVGVSELPARICTPGAVTSGLMMSGDAGAPMGPLEEKAAIELPRRRSRSPSVILTVAWSPLAAM